MQKKPSSEILGPLELRRLRKALTSYHRVTNNIVDDQKFYDPERDGVTFSALSAFRRCKEYSRLNLRGVTARTTGKSIVFGEITHGILQNVYGAIRAKQLTAAPSPAYVRDVLTGVQNTWKAENPRASAQALADLEYSMIIADATLPLYFKYWRDTDFKMEWLALEREFKIPVSVAIPGRTIQTFVRGKMDGNFRMDGLRLLETKTKGHIDESVLSDILPHELQVNLYMWAMRKLHGETPKGVLYNIIRRPGLRQRKSESLAQFARRCAEDVRLRPDWYFIRLDMDVDAHHIHNFHYELKDLLKDFMTWWYGMAGHYKNSDQCENKYGKCSMLAWCARRDNMGLYIRPRVFRELEEI